MFDFKKFFELQKQMQDKVEETKRNLAQRMFEGVAGGSLVSAYINGNLEVTSIKIDNSVFDAGHKQLLEMLIVSAINDALNKAQDAMSEEMKNVLGSFGNFDETNFNPFIK